MLESSPIEEDEMEPLDLNPQKAEMVLRQHEYS